MSGSRFCGCSQNRESERRVFQLCPRRERERVRHHCFQGISGSGVVDGAEQNTFFIRIASDAGLMRKQLPQGHALIESRELRQILPNRNVQGKLALLHQVHDDRARYRFRNEASRCTLAVVSRTPCSMSAFPRAVEKTIWLWEATATESPGHLVASKRSLTS